MSSRQQTICPSCAYQRQESDNAPDWSCPSCGVAYAKFGSEPVFPDDTTCPRCRYTRSAADPDPHWRCPGCGAAYAKLGLEPEYPADAFCTSCFYTRQPEDQGPHWRCPSCGEPYAGEVEPVDEMLQPDPGVELRSAQTGRMRTENAASPQIQPQLPGPQSAAVTLPLSGYALRVAAAYSGGFGCLVAMYLFGCGPILGVWLACIYAIHAHHRLQKMAAEVEQRISVETMRRERAPLLPAPLGIASFIIGALLFAAGNYLLVQYCF